MKQKVLLVLLVVSMVLLVAVSSVIASAHQTIMEIAEADGRFTTMVAAVKAAGLDDDLSGGEWTLFAPTDDAFAKLGLNADNIADQADLADHVLYHAMTKKVDADGLMGSLGDLTMANGKLTGLKEFDGSLYVNDDSKIISDDIFGSNGIFYVVDTVIQPPWPRTGDGAAAVGGGADAVGNTIVDVLDNDGRFDTLAAAVTAAGLADDFAAGEWTLFAPTDDAFAKLDLNADNVGDREDLADHVLYHAMKSKVDEAGLLGSLGDITMANGKLAGLKKFDGSFYVNDDSKVLVIDIFTDNGFIHVIDTVIQPPWPRAGE